MKQHLHAAASVLLFAFWCALSVAALAFIGARALGVATALSLVGLLLTALVIVRRP